MGRQLSGEREGRYIHVSGGFLVLLAFLFWLDEGVGLLLPACIAAALHELGHLSAIFLLGGRVKEIHLTAIGAEIRLEDTAVFSYWRDAAVALAGPLSGLVCGWIAFQMRYFLLAAMCAAQGIFNLMPVMPLDGGRVLYALAAALLDDRWGERILSITSAVTAGVLLGGGLILLRQYGNPTLLITAGWLMTGIFRRKE